MLYYILHLIGADVQPSDLGSILASLGAINVVHSRGKIKQSTTAKRQCGDNREWLLPGMSLLLCSVIC